MTHLGLDIGGTSVKAALWSNDQWVRTGQSAPYEQPTLAQLRDAIQHAAGAASDLQTVGLCLPGIFDPQSRALTHCVNIPALVGLPLDSFLQDALALPTPLTPHICADARAAAHDIYTTRQLTGRLFSLSLGTGIGCGVLDGPSSPGPTANPNPIPLNVDEGSPGHFGQLDVSLPDHHVLGPDGGAGSLEGYLGTPALRRAYPGTLPEILARLTPDAPPLRALARALRIAHAIYRPHHICLAGGTALGLTHLLPALRSAVETNLTSIARPYWTLTSADDLFHAARGAVCFASAV